MHRQTGVLAATRVEAAGRAAPAGTEQRGNPGATPRRPSLRSLGRPLRPFLDDDRQYSCAHFRTQNAKLEQVQAVKKNHIARKLLLEPGTHVLDIGRGWGGTALTLARDQGAQVLGITLSTEQHAVATERAARQGLADRVEFQPCDCRDVEGTFDRILSVGMFEHLGLANYETYFRVIRDRLSPDGVAFLHTIGWTAPPDATNPWIAKYNFPGGYIPTLSEIAKAVETATLWPTDVEYCAYELRHWFNRCRENEATVWSLYDDGFVRMWGFYLAACEQTFRHGAQGVYQIHLSRSIDAAPLTRDYLWAETGSAPMHRAAE